MGRLEKLIGMIPGIELKANPLVNEHHSINNLEGQSQTSNSPVDYSVLWDYIKKSPEALIPMHTIISDVIADGYKVVDYRHDASGAKRIRKAKEWLSINKFSTAISQPLLWDSLATGDSYLYLPRVSETAINNKITELVENIGLQNKTRAANKIYMKYAMDYSFGSYDLIPLPSETVKITHNNHQEVLKYVQRVGTKEEEFTPEEVIHNKYIHMNGKIYGFTPMKAVLSELQIIANAKDILGYGLEKGGIPEFMFIMEEESPKSPNVRNLAHQLRRFKSIENKKRSLLLTGKVNVETLTPSMQEMMFKDIIDVFSKIVMMVWGVPPSKMGMVGEKGSAYDSGLATEGYYKKVSTLQDWFYSPFNWEFMIPKFGIELVPRKAYLQDEVRESQVFMQKVDSGLKLYASGFIKPEYITEVLLEIPEEYVGDFKPKEVEMGEQRQNLAQNKEVNKNISQQEIDASKKKKQKQNQNDFDEDEDGD